MAVLLLFFFFFFVLYYGSSLGRILSVIGGDYFDGNLEKDILN